METMKIKLIALLIIGMSTVANAQEISDEFPYESKFIGVENHRLHYIDVGEGDPILFLHGVPMSNYSWRNIIPHLSDSARCIAPDLMGFGKSDKPDIEYSFDDQFRYLENLIDTLRLQNITLVMTDVGGIIGQKYARLHPENIKGLVFMETPIADAKTFHKNGGMMQHMLFRMGSKEKLGHRMFVRKNMFIKMMPKLIKRKLSDSEKEAYAAPFKTEQSRMSMYKLISAFPLKGKNVSGGDMGYYLNLNSEWLETSSHPKLILAAKPGMLMNKKNLAWASSNLSNLQIEHLGKAKHLMEEDLPNEIGLSVREWYFNLK